MSDLRRDLAGKGAGAMIVTALDEIAWLFNIRGEAIPYSPVVRAYALITKVTGTVRCSLCNDNYFCLVLNLSLPVWRSHSSSNKPFE